MLVFLVVYCSFGIWHKSMEEWEHSYWPALEQLGQFYKVQTFGEVFHPAASCICRLEAQIKWEDGSVPDGVL
jgi:hypothetical protein